MFSRKALSLRKFSCSIIVLISLLSLSPSILVGVTAYRPQEIILYTEQNYTGRQKSFYESASNLSSDSVGKIARSHCVVRGLWRVLGTFSTSPAARFIENVYGDGKAGKVCGSWNTPNITADYNSILLIGSQDLDTPAIQFHVRPRFYGEPDLFLDGRILRLQKPMNFSSYGFTGRHNWTLFRNTDLTGHSECLVADLDPLGDTTMVSFNVNKSMTVGSIWRGCGALDPKVLGRQEMESKAALGLSKPSISIHGVVQVLLVIFVGISTAPVYTFSSCSR